VPGIESCTPGPRSNQSTIDIRLWGNAFRGLWIARRGRIEASDFQPRMALLTQSGARSCLPLSRELTDAVVGPVLAVDAKHLTGLIEDIA
jgi:hypothetical protein